MSLTDEEVAEISPAAAAASALIKGGVSLTAIYREHSRVVAELEASKAERSRLEEHINEFVEVTFCFLVLVLIFADVSLVSAMSVTFFHTFILKLN